MHALVVARECAEEGRIACALSVDRQRGRLRHIDGVSPVCGVTFLECVPSELAASGAAQWPVAAHYFMYVAVGLLCVAGGLAGYCARRDVLFLCPS